MTNISNEVIAQFLEGKNPLKYVVGIETSYGTNLASIIINDPVEGKKIDHRYYKSFAWITHELGAEIFKRDRAKMLERKKYYGISIKTLKTTNSLGIEPERMKFGYKYLIECSGSNNDLNAFIKESGVNIRGDFWRSQILSPSPTEQFMIQTGIRLFKGLEEYNDLHRLQFDLETTGLNPSICKINQIGIRDNRGFQHIIEVTGNTPSEVRESERTAIKLFGKLIPEICPDMITGYNSEDFDWGFLEARCELLGIRFKEVFKGLDGSGIYRKAARLKLGQDTVNYQQAYLWGYNILDISHAVRKTMAINSEIKGWGLKYITKYSEIEKSNRVYVKGDQIGTIWADKENKYWFNDTNGNWEMYIKGKNDNLSDNGYELTTGKYIVDRYLIDDLWETDKVDEKFNQAAFLLSKLIPTSYMRSSTMGTAGVWQLIMMAWSYENDLAVPKGQPQKTFTGGLSRLLEVGYARRVIKLDYAALYPNIEITWDIFPEHDISGVMKGLLVYIAETRDIYKGLKGDYEKKAEALKKQMSVEGISKEEYIRLESEWKEASALSSTYDMKQLPIKILANSFFGAYGAPHIFRWGDINSAEETTCRGRQSLRLMNEHFWGKYKFRPLVCDTDGMNFAVPDSADEVEYLCQGNHRFTVGKKGQLLKGVEAIVAEFNDLYMEGRMGLDIDDICESTINFSRKNYANHIIKKGKSKIKLVGNTIKSNKMPKYIEEFLDKGVRFLLDNKGLEFIELYYKTVDDIVNFRIPLSKIASKAKIRSSYQMYEEKCNSLNKAGNPMPRQAHMELAKKHELIINIGDTIYYINTGKSAKDGDIKTIKNKITNKIESVELNCKLLPIEDVENNPDATTDEYNAFKYLEMFNNRLKRLLVCFKPDVRDKILVSFVDNKEIYTLVNGRKKYSKELEDRNYFTDSECQLCAGIPLNDIDQDDIDLDLMMMEDREVEFWKRVNKTPNNMTEHYWEKFLIDYEERKVLTKKYNDFKDREMLIKDLFNLVPSDFDLFKTGKFPEWMLKKYVVKPIHNSYGQMINIMITNKSDTYDICSFEKVFYFEKIIKEIDEWKKQYKTKKTTSAWFKKFGDDLDFNEYYKHFYDMSFTDDETNITFIPREYKDYDALYAQADAEFVDELEA